MLRVIHGENNSLVLLAYKVAAKAFRQRNTGAFLWGTVIWARDPEIRRKWGHGRVLRTSAKVVGRILFLGSGF